MFIYYVQGFHPKTSKFKNYLNYWPKLYISAINSLNWSSICIIYLHGCKPIWINQFFLLHSYYGTLRRYLKITLPIDVSFFFNIYFKIIWLILNTCINSILYPSMAWKSLYFRRRYFQLTEKTNNLVDKPTEYLFTHMGL